MNDLTLVIMAGGLGSRYKGLKQIDGVGPTGEYIIDYSIYDAIKCGFKKVVFIIKSENYEVFKETIGQRINDKIEVSYVFQDQDIPSIITTDRTKPLGTSHAIWCCRNIVKGNFVIINADDYYGFDAFKTISDYFKTNHDNNTFCMVGYKVANTLTANGSVKRGICKEKNGYLESIIESKVEQVSNEIMATPLSNDLPPFKVSNDDLTSMNMFGFTNLIFDYLDKGLIPFIKNMKDPLNDEYLIPDVVMDNIINKNCKVKVLKTSAKWYGMTYHEDREMVVNALLEMTKEGLYNSPLWK